MQKYCTSVLIYNTNTTHSVSLRVTTLEIDEMTECSLQTSQASTAADKTSASAVLAIV